MGLSRAEKMRVYEDSVEIVKAAYGSDTAYNLDKLPEVLQNTYDKLIEIFEDVDGIKKD